MKYLFLVFTLFIITITGFKSADFKHKSLMNNDSKRSSKDTTEFLMKKFKNGVSFYAIGNEPFWNLEIGKDKFLKFNVLDGVSIDLGAVKSEKAMDANIIRYFTKTDKGNFTATIYDEKCLDNMSGEEFKYKVVVELNDQGDKDYKKYEGCGRYVPDYDINRSWSLKKINGIEINETDFPNGEPQITFDIEMNRFSGTGGCNRIFGSATQENNLLRFGKIASTMMACPNLDKEQEFVKTLEQVVYYSVTGNQLILSNPDKELFVFSSIDGNSNEKSVSDGTDINRLYDIWVLESLNGIPADPKNYMKELPRLEPNATEMKFTGSGGCNNINGKIEVKENKISFSEIASTRMMCPGNYESDFLNALKSVNEWKVENMKLYLSLDGKDLIVLRKID